jgi:hypothetical protein
MRELARLDRRVRLFATRRPTHARNHGTQRYLGLSPGQLRQGFSTMVRATTTRTRRARWDDDAIAGRDDDDGRRARAMRRRETTAKGDWVFVASRARTMMRGRAMRGTWDGARREPLPTLGL